MLVSVWKRVPKSAVWLLLAAGAALLILLPRGGTSSKSTEEARLSFSLDKEERRIENALSRIEGAGKVTVVLTLEASEEKEYARNTDSDRQNQADSGRSEERSEIAKVGSGALTVKVSYPRYRGARVIAEGSGSALRLALTQAVASLTGLGTDRITVVTGR